ncbi:MAG: hypothetical protein GX594_00420 [Pirellulaceae bacterium]|nr:hypothetical protein [Pirellulaceae bacterium]
MRPSYLSHPIFSDQQTPSLDLIRQRCLAIQESWTRREERRRRLVPHLDCLGDSTSLAESDGWTPPLVSVDLL